MKCRIIVVAEAGINHNGDINLAREMIRTARECGVDCIKFQTFKADEFVSDPNQTYTYRSKGQDVTESMLEMFKRYEFSQKEWTEIVGCCQDHGVAFSSTAQNISDLEMLLAIADLPFIKVGSDDLTNLELLDFYASKNRPMVISAGMAYAYEIEDAVRTIRRTGNEDITVLHCVSSYPAAAEEVNLKKIPIIRDAFGVKVGFSDHTVGTAAAVGAVCFGATMVEKHFTLDNNLPGPDHWFSINKEELKDYVKQIRFIEEAMGTSVLRPTDKEMQMRRLARRKIVAGEEIKKGELITRPRLALKRSEVSDGIEPKNISFVLNRRAARDVAKNCGITPNDLE
ncbi:MAG: N-acetylneuraminate synthase family protein [Deltaproteobacteria bacterium]|nr:N-acetylneuraminate synthase family protein [Deltaproteobacteria bacterium]